MTTLVRGVFVCVNCGVTRCTFPTILHIGAAPLSTPHILHVPLVELLCAADYTQSMLISVVIPVGFLFSCCFNCNGTTCVNLCTLSKACVVETQ